MALAGLANLMFPQDRPRTDWDVAANLIRMAVMMPMIREERGYQLLQRLMPFLSAMPEEQRAEWWQQNVVPIVEKYGLRGVPPAMPSLKVLSFADLDKIDPNLAEQIKASVAAAVQQSLPPGATPEMAARAAQNILTLLNPMPLRVWERPGGGYTIDAASYSAITERLPAQIVALAGQPGMYRQNAREFLVGQGLGGVVSLLEQYPEGKLLLASDVDLSNRQGFLANVGTIVTNRADSLIRTVDTARQLLAQNPSYVSYKEFMDLLRSIEQVARQGWLGPDGLAYLKMARAGADWVMSNVKEVTVGILKDGKPQTVLMPIAEAEKYMTALINRYTPQLEAVATALASSKDPVEQRQLLQEKERIIREGQALGIPAKVLYAAYYNAALQQNKLRDLQIRERELEIARLREAHAAAKVARELSEIEKATAQVRLKMEQRKWELSEKLRRGGLAGMTEGELLTYGIDPRSRIPLTEAKSWRETTSNNYANAQKSLIEALPGRGKLDPLLLDASSKFASAAVADIQTAKYSPLGPQPAMDVRRQLPMAIREYGTLATDALQKGRISPDTFWRVWQDLTDVVDIAYGEGIIDRATRHTLREMLKGSFTFSAGAAPPRGLLTLPPWLQSRLNAWWAARSYLQPRKQPPGRR